jgi:hypothetical protein
MSGIVRKIPAEKTNSRRKISARETSTTTEPTGNGWDLKYISFCRRERKY